MRRMSATQQATRSWTSLENDIFKLFEETAHQVFNIKSGSIFNHIMVFSWEAKIVIFNLIFPGMSYSYSK